MPPGAVPFRRYTRWSKTSASDQNRLRESVEQLSRAGVAEGSGFGQSQLAGVPMLEPAEEPTFWLQVTAPPEGADTHYAGWQEVIDDGAGGFVAPGDGMTGSDGFLAYELMDREAGVGGVFPAWHSGTDPATVTFDAGSSAGGTTTGDQTFENNVTIDQDLTVLGDTLLEFVTIDQALYLISQSFTFTSATSIDIVLLQRSYYLFSLTFDVSLFSLNITAPGSMFFLFVNASSFNLTLKHDDGTHGTPSMRFYLPRGEDHVCRPGEQMFARYDPVANRYRVSGRSYKPKDSVEAMNAAFAAGTHSGIAVAYSGTGEGSFSLSIAPALGTAAFLASDNNSTLAANSFTLLPTQFAVKGYVDGLFGIGSSWKNSVRVATTAAGTLATSFENGDTIDGVTLVTGDAILIKDQADGAENGIYTVSASGVPLRRSDADTGAKLFGAATKVRLGTVNAGTAWWVTNDGIVLGTTALTWLKIGVFTTSGETYITLSGQVLTASKITEAQQNITDVTTANASTTAHGYLKKLSNVSTEYMSGTGVWSTPAGGSGTVTSVGLSVPSILSVSGSPVTTSGTLAVTLATQTANTLFAGPTSGGAATPTFRVLVLADYPADLMTVAKMHASATDVLFGRSTASAGAGEEIVCTAAGRALLDDVAASNQRTTLGLGTIATQNANAVAITGGTLDGITILSVRDLSAAFDVKISLSSSVALGAPRTLFIDVVNNSRVLKISGDATVSGVNTGDVTASGETFVTLSGQAFTISKVTEAQQNLTDVTTADVSTTKHGYAPKAPNDNSKFLDGNGNWTKPAGTGGQLVYSNTSIPAGNTVANTATETAFNSSYTIPANGVAAGDVYYLLASGTYAVSMAATLRVKVKIGSTVVWDSAAQSPGPSGTQAWNLGVKIQVLSTGSSGSFEVQGSGVYQNSTTTQVLLGPVNTASFTINTTTTQAVTITAQWGSAAVGNTITLRQMAIERITATASVVDRGIAKAWVVFTTNTTTSITESYGISSLVDNGTGDTTINWSTPFASTSYAAVCSAGNEVVGVAIPGLPITARSASSIRLLLRNGSNNPQDYSYISVVAYGDQ